ncbi:MAG: hypothetical protein JXA19_04415 [Anaerolineales bacterium]|nr:hypothetical protein [Anaerolineales bacterium]
MKINKSKLFPPLILLGLVLVSYGIYAASWGYYWDDWMVVSLNYNFGVEGLTDFLASGGRAFYSYFLGLFIGLFGYTPLVWQIFNLFTHWLAGYCLYLLFLLIWPKQEKPALWTALLFIVYPVFFLHAMGLIISLDYLLFAIFFLSLSYMIRSFRDSKKRWIWGSIAIALAAFHIFVKEYFLGLELIRPVILFILVVQKGKESKFWFRIWKTILWWLPYALTAGSYVVYRIFLISPSHEQNPMVMLDLILSSPLKGILAFSQLALRNSLHVVFSAWADVFKPENIDLSSLSSLGIWALVLVAGVILGLCFWKKKDEQDNSKRAQDWILQAFCLGVIAILVGSLPSWITGRDMLKGLYADRFAMPAIMGAAILWTALIHWLVSGKVQKVILFSLIIALAAGLQIRTGNDFRWDWEKQQRFYWQLYWRAPELEPGTVIIADGSLSGYVNGYSAGFALNVLYPHTLDQSNLVPTYWYLDVNDFDNIIPDFMSGMVIEDELLNLKFTGDSEQAIFVYYAPESGKCLWTPDGDDVENIILPSAMRELAGKTDYSAIIADTSYSPPTKVFGPEPEHTWCYYYQKIELARQNKDWEKILELWHTAQENDFHPNSSFELVPVMEAYAYTGSQAEAKQLAKDIYRRDLATQGVLCNAWFDIEGQAQDIGVSQNTIDEVKEFTSCP